VREREAALTQASCYASQDKKGPFRECWAVFSGFEVLSELEVFEEPKGLTWSSVGYKLPQENRWGVEIAHLSLLDQSDRLWEVCWTELSSGLVLWKEREEISELISSYEYLNCWKRMQ
jgi:hypothetical protein